MYRALASCTSFTFPEIRKTLTDYPGLQQRTIQYLLKVLNTFHFFPKIKPEKRALTFTISNNINRFLFILLLKIFNIYLFQRDFSYYLKCIFVYDGSKCFFIRAIWYPSQILKTVTSSHKWRESCVFHRTKGTQSKREYKQWLFRSQGLEFREVVIKELGVFY